MPDLEFLAVVFLIECVVAASEVECKTIVVYIFYLEIDHDQNMYKICIQMINNHIVYPILALSRDRFLQSCMDQF